MKNHRASLKQKAINNYGGKCTCCNESTLIFLCIDHINGGGNKHRRDVGLGESGSGWKTYDWLIKNNFPDGFQVLCFNCNNAKHLLGVCPHLNGPIV